MTSIKNNEIPILLATITLCLLGTFSLMNIPVTLMPSNEEPVLSIITEYFGMEPKTIEELITKPIESVLKETYGIKKMYSFSSKGKSKIIVYLFPKIDADQLSVIIKDSLTKVTDFFPEEAHLPVIYRYNTDEAPVMIASLSSDKYNTEELYNLCEYQLKQDLLSIDGVANIELFGSSPDEYFIMQNYENVYRSNADYDKLFSTVVSNSFSLPLGRINFDTSKLYFMYPNKYESMHIIPKYRINLKKTGSETKNEPAFGADFLKIEKSKRKQDKAAFVNNETTVSLAVFKKNEGNILSISKGIKGIFKKNSSQFSYIILNDQGAMFQNLLVQLQIAIITSIIIVMCILVFFFKRFLYIFSVSFSIPVSLLGTLAFLFLSGRTLNLLSLSGIIIGIGTCVDNTIVFIETLQAGLHDPSLDVDDVLKKTIQSSNTPILASILTSLIVFVPFFYLTGGKNKLYIDFALSLTMILAVSYFYSMLFVPAFLSFFRGKWEKNRHKMMPQTFINSVSTQNALRNVLNKIMKKGVLVTGIILCLVILSVFIFINKDLEDISPLDEKQYEFYYEFDPQYTDEYKIKELLAIGNDIASQKINGLLYTRLEDAKATLMIKYPLEFTRFKKEVNAIKNRFEGKKRDDGFYYFKKSKETKLNTFTLYIMGDDYERLSTFVDALADKIGKVSGIKNILKGHKEGLPELRIELQKDVLFQMGVTDTDVITYLRYLFYFPVLMKHYETDHLVDVRGRIDLKSMTVKDFGVIKIPDKKGNFIFLKDIAAITLKNDISMISRKNSKRYISLELHYSGRSEMKLSGDIMELFNKEQWPEDMYYEFDEEIIERQKDSLLFIAIIIFAILLIYIVLGIIVNSYTIPIVIIITLPTIVCGAALFLVISGYNRSIPVNIGVIMSAGFTVNNIILIFEGLIGKKFSQETLFNAFYDKMQSILLTTLTTVLSIIPIFFLSGTTDFFMALTGTFFLSLTVSTILALIVIPFLYKSFQKSLLRKF